MQKRRLEKATDEIGRDIPFLEKLQSNLPFNQNQNPPHKNFFDAKLAKLSEENHLLNLQNTCPAHA